MSQFTAEHPTPDLPDNLGGANGSNGNAPPPAADSRSMLLVTKFSKSQQAKVHQSQAKIREVFQLYQKDHLLDTAELGNVLRALDIAPTNAQVKRMREECDDDYVTVQKLESMVLGPMVTHQYNDELISRDSDDSLLKAFELLDEEKKGYIETERFVELMRSLGEPMAEEEIAEFLHAAEDPDQHVIRYEEYISRCLGQS